MKHIYSVFCVVTLSFFAKAQSFSPAIKSGTSNTFAYNFSQVKSNSSKQIDFVISGVANGSTFYAKIDQELDFVDEPYCTSDYGIAYGDSNYVITSAKSGTITQNKGVITVMFNPKDFNYYSPVFGKDWLGNPTDYVEYCEELTYANYGVKTATMTVTLYTPNATNYTINLSGNSVDVVTALQTDIKTKEVLFYPNPVKDVLVLNQEATVLDAFGKIVLSGKGTLDVSGMQSGVYFVRSEGQTQKFLKE